jgi:O-antigen/teichoic acid export membrane protein
MEVARGLRAHLGHAQNRNAYCLMANNAIAAATGVLFLLLFTRALGLPAEELGVGYAIVSLATIVAVLAKGGFDTAILRTVPVAQPAQSRRLYRLGVLVGCVLAVAGATALAVANGLPDRSLAGWAITAALGALLVATWLQDAWFLAAGDAWPSLQRNLVLGAGRLAAPFAVVAVAVPHPFAASLVLALALSAAAGALLARRLGAPVPSALLPPVGPTAKGFLRTAFRNAASSAAEFLPGLLLAPVVLAAAGPSAAGAFAIAWSGASLLFLASSAMARAALAALTREPERGAQALRRALAQHAMLVLPGALLLAVAAPLWMGVFGMSHAQAASSTLAALALSIVLVAPANLHLAVLRARDSSVALVAYPAATVLLLLAAAPPLIHLWGLPGAAAAWAIACLPLGTAGWRTVVGALTHRGGAPAAGGVA